jgi:hypothetical protein
MKAYINRRRFIENSLLAALVPYFGKAGAETTPVSSFGPDATAEQVTGHRPLRQDPGRDRLQFRYRS